MATMQVTRLLKTERQQCDLQELCAKCTCTRLLDQQCRKTFRKHEGQIRLLMLHCIETVMTV